MKISVQEVKTAMRDIKFRLSLPPEFKEDIQKYELNPSCLCNLPIYKKVLQKAKDQLKAYFPGKEIEEFLEEKPFQNNWSIINCTIHELESKMRNLPPGRKQIAIARYEDKVTIVINEIDIGEI